jgi:hypothetical protein
MSKEESEYNQIRGYLVVAKDGELTHCYVSEGFVIECEERLLAPDNPKVRRMEQRVIELLKEISKIDKDFKFYYGWTPK